MESDFMKVERILNKATDELYDLSNEVLENGNAELAEKLDRIREGITEAWNIALDNL